MDTVERIENRIEGLLAELNANPTMENVKRIESEMDYYSDVYKDEYGVRPGLLYYRRRYNEKAWNLFQQFWNSL